jgi:hypothetical protein
MAKIKGALRRWLTLLIRVLRKGYRDPEDTRWLWRWAMTAIDHAIKPLHELVSCALRGLERLALAVGLPPALLDRHLSQFFQYRASAGAKCN